MKFITFYFVKKELTKITKSIEKVSSDKNVLFVYDDKVKKV